MPSTAEHADKNKFKKSVPPAFDSDPPNPDNEIASRDLLFSEGESATPVQTPLTTERQGANLVEASPNPNYLPNDLAPSPLQSTQLYSPVRKYSISKDRHSGENVRLSSAQLAIPSRKQERLIKKLRKLTNTFIPPTRNDSTLVWRDKGQVYTVKLRHKEAETASSFDELEVEVTTERYGRTLSTKMNMKRLGFSQFAQFIDYWDPYVMVHDDKFDGRFHTNTAFKLSTGRAVHPIFKGKVTTSGYDIRQSDPFGFVSSDSIFRGGLETGTPEIKFPRKLYHLVENAIDDSTTKIFDEEVWITFHREGSFSWITKSGKRSQKRHRLPAAPFTIVGQSKKKMHVRGTLRGKMLVYNKGHIIIDGSLTYARALEIFDQADDYLGLVSEKNIEIAPPKVTGPGDLHIYAAMLAKGRFVVKNFHKPERATLHIYGSLTAGSLTATEPRYATRIRFDKRLETKRPPFFPMTDRYELQQWDGKWQVKSSGRQKQE